MENHNTRFRLLPVLAAALLMIPINSFAQEKTLEEMTIEELMKIQVISASNRLQELREAPATIYVITEEDIRQYGYRDLKDILNHLPGIEYSNAHSNLQGGQRGFAENWSQTKLLINGRQANKLWSGESYIASQYTLNNVKQIEIIQGPASALYGADAFTGVINIITKNSANSEEHSDISFALGSVDKAFDSKQLSFNLITKKKNLGVTLSGTIFNQEGPDFTEFVRTAQYTEDNRQLRNEMLNNGNPYRDNNRSYNANADFNYSISDNTNIEAGIYFLRDEDGGGIESPEISYTNFSYISEQILTYLRFEKEFDSYPVKLTVDALREDEDDLIRFQNREDEGDNPPYLGVFNIEDCNSHSVNAQLDIAPESIPNYLIAGFGYYKVSIGAPAFTGLSSADSTLGNPIVGRYLYPPKGYFSNLNPYLDQSKTYIYLQDQHSFLNNKIQVTLGGRYDYHNIYGSITSIRSGLYIHLIKNWAVKALYGEAFREPTMFEFSENPDLKPTEMKTWELSLHFNPIENIAGQLVYFRNYASMIIEEAPGIEDIIVNSGNKKVEGLESLVKWQYKSLRGNFWYSYERNPDDINFMEVAKNKFGFGFVLNISEKLSVSLQGKYTDKINGYALDEDLNEITIIIPEYKSINLTLLAHQINFPTLPEIDFSFSIYNLFDTRNLYPDVRGSNPSCFLEEGRSFYGRCAVYF
ncbi:MAG: TonB-dependent receptor plug domain-containing protein [Melioribacteraceae bacterium]|nr:TonB-dependent receptor plug domain-containing protein [Melioribacteraceae bacterium]MCF8355365.1 TonB-dependent receptor plug domain-containing protein [Melioribacteraceae bacterium]MCF8395177.1 TonB-dependent receptor plug domain-containing protein [Melioribacteraceae bacterium]MCF8420254.1 TonB-dependent receptor plug domain-containing protein [Melioribacteraceae bacterium]